MAGIKKYLKNNLPIENKLHVIGVVSNCCLYDIKYKLAREFIKRMEEEDNIIFYLTELAYGDQEFMISSANNPRHLQLRTQVPLWHKENVINITIKKLLPSTWKAVAWLDTDIEFENITWASDTLKLLKEFDIVQMFSHCLYLDNMNNPETIQQSYAFLDYNNLIKKQLGIAFPHSGYAWACTHDFYNRINGLFEYGIVGSGDFYLVKALYNLENKVNGISIYFDDFYKKYFDNIVNQKPKIGYVPVIIKHYYHGDKNNRQYNSRNNILIKNNYDPEKDITKDNNGLLIPTFKCSENMLSEILEYFKNRKESLIQTNNNDLNKKLILLSKQKSLQNQISFIKTPKLNNNIVESSNTLNIEHKYENKHKHEYEHEQKKKIIEEEFKQKKIIEEFKKNNQEEENKKNNQEEEENKKKKIIEEENKKKKIIEEELKKKIIAHEEALKKANKLKKDQEELVKSLELKKKARELEIKKKEELKALELKKKFKIIEPINSFKAYNKPI